MPKPLFMKLIAVCAIGFFCVLLGCVYSISSHDHVFLLLSLLIGLCSLIRFISLYQMIRFHRYLTIEGQCKKREPAMFKKTVQVLLLTEDGREYRFTLDKNVKILQGHHYRLYFRIPDSKENLTDISNAFHAFLGAEEITSVASAKSSDSP